MRFPFTVHKTKCGQSDFLCQLAAKLLCMAILALKPSGGTCVRMDHRDGLKCKDVERLFRKKEEKGARDEVLMEVEERGQMSGGWKKVSDEWIGQAN